MKEQVLIFPLNGNGLEALTCLSNKYEFIGFVDDTPEKQGRSAYGYEVYSRKALKKFPKAKILAVPGSATSYKTRDHVISGLKIEKKRYITVIHPQASVSPLAKIGENVLIMAGVVITSNAKIGNNVCILPNTVIHHDTAVGDYTLVGSNVTIAGYVKIGAKCYIGSGSRIINNISIGNNSLIGMGTNVIRKVPANSKAVGNPAKLI